MLPMVAISGRGYDGGVCTDEGFVTAPPALLHDVELKDVIDLEPVDAVVVTTLIDNVTDIFMPDQGPARRFDGLDCRRLRRR